jgi:hypothetical protein
VLLRCLTGSPTWNLRTRLASARRTACVSLPWHQGSGQFVAALGELVQVFLVHRLDQIQPG